MAKIRYPINQYVGYGRYVTKYLTRSEYIKYLKRWNKKITKSQIKRSLKEDGKLIK